MLGAGFWYRLLVDLVFFYPDGCLVVLFVAGDLALEGYFFALHFQERFVAFFQFYQEGFFARINHDGYGFARFVFFQDLDRARYFWHVDGQYRYAHQDHQSDEYFCRISIHVATPLLSMLPISIYHRMQITRLWFRRK